MQIRKTNLLKSALRSSRRAFLLVGLFSLFINLMMLVVPIYMLQIYDRVLTSQSRETLLALTVLAVALIALSGLVDVARSRLLVRISANLDHQMRGPLFLRAFYDIPGNQSRTASQPIRDLENLRTFLTGAGILAFFDGPWAPVYLAVIFLLHPVLGVVALVGALVILVLAVASEFAVRQPLDRAGRWSRGSNDFVDLVARNAEAVRVMGMLPDLQQRWSGRHDTSVAWQATASDRIAVIQSLAKSVRMGLQIAILGFGAWLVLDHALSAGAMVAASIIMGRALAPIEAAIGHWRGFVGARQSQRRIEALLDTTEQSGERTRLPAPCGRVTVDQVALRLPAQGEPILQGVSFDLEAGDILGLIGPSGAGKSTLARLIVGALSPTVGSVRLDGAEIGAWPDDEVGPYIGYLPQDMELLPGTVAQNISRFGAGDSENIVAAAKVSGVHDLILSLPEGYETLLGQGGTHLSGGQRQRIGLARAIYDRARLIVLDEPNTNLDSMGENALRTAISTLKDQKRTVIIITHKPSLLAEADKILVLRDGRVDSFGSRDNVLAAMAHPSIAATNAAVQGNSPKAFPRSAEVKP
ncbi:MAG: type I secretion system permease/ATPase [Hyphomicrobiaceae bacterium]